MKYFLGIALVCLSGCHQLEREWNSTLRSISDDCLPEESSLTLEDQLISCQGVSGKFSDTVTTCLDEMYTLLHYEVTDECQDSFKEEVLDTAYTIVRKQSRFLSRTVSNETGAQTISERHVKDFFGNLNFWYKNFVVTYYSSESDDRIGRELDNIYTSMWNNINEAHASQILIGNESEESIQYATDIANWGMDSLTETELLIRNLAPTLDIVESRLALHTKLHDFVCLSKRCFEGGSTNSSDALDLLKTLRSVMLGNRNSIRSADIDIREFAESLQRVEKIVSPALRTSGIAGVFSGINLENDEDILRFSPQDAPTYLKGYLSFLQTQNARIINYEKTGLFNTRVPNKIAFNLERNNIDRIADYSRRLATKLKNSIGSCEENQTRYLQQVLGNISNIETQAGLDIQQAGLEAEMGYIVNDIKNISSSILSDEEQLAIYLDQSSRIKNNEESVFNRQAYVVDGTSVTSISASAANFNGNPEQLVKNATKIPPISTGNGSSIVHLEISGRWSPTCALNKSIYKQSSPVMTGPEGYSLNVSSENARVNSEDRTKSTTNYEDRNFSVSACLKAETNIVPNLLKATASACANYTVGQRREKTHRSTESTMSSLRNTANFAKGMRLPSTPFPNAPAGSLLAVITKAGEDKISTAVNKQVVSGRTSIMLGAGETLHLVVNDCSDQEASAETLKVKIETATPVSAIAQNYLDVMLTTMQDLDNDFIKGATELILSGYSTPSELNNLRGLLKSTLALETPDNGSYHVAALNSMFDYWVDTWILQLERKAQMIQFDRKLEQIANRLDGIESSRSYQVKSKLVRETLLHHVLSNSDLQLLSRDFISSLDYANNILFPMILLHFPSLDDGHLSEVSGAGEYNLRDADSIPIFIEAKKAAEMFQQSLSSLISNVEQEQSYIFQNDQPTIVAMEVPRPDRFDETEQFNAQSPTASFAMASRIWSGLEEVITDPQSEQSTLSFEIRPKDLYRQDVSGDRLTCQQSNVIVESMLISFGLSGRDRADRIAATDTRHNVQLTMGSEMTVVSPEAPRRYELASFDDRPLGNFALGIRFYDNDIPSFRNQLTVNGPDWGAMQGMSPFTTYDVKNLNALRSVIKTQCDVSNLNCVEIDNLETMFIVFQMKATSAAPVNWLPACN